MARSPLCASGLKVHQIRTASLLRTAPRATALSKGNLHSARSTIAAVIVDRPRDHEPTAADGGARCERGRTSHFDRRLGSCPREPVPRVPAGDRRCARRGPLRPTHVASTIFRAGLRLGAVDGSMEHQGLNALFACTQIVVRRGCSSRSPALPISENLGAEYPRSLYIRQSSGAPVRLR